MVEEATPFQGRSVSNEADLDLAAPCSVTACLSLFSFSQAWGEVKVTRKWFPPMPHTSLKTHKTIHAPLGMGGGFKTAL